MSVRRPTPKVASAAPQFVLDESRLRAGVARSLTPGVALGCRRNTDIEALSRNDPTLIHALNAPYLRSYPGEYPKPSIQLHGNSIMYESKAYMEHNLKVILTSMGEGDDNSMTITITTHPNPIEDVDTGERVVPPSIPVVHEVYKRTDEGCYKRLFQSGYEIEHRFKAERSGGVATGGAFTIGSAASLDAPHMSGAPYFSATGVALQAMLETASNDFTGNQAMLHGNQIPLHNQVRFLITHYATAIEVFRPKEQLSVLHERLRQYQMSRPMTPKMMHL